MMTVPELNLTKGIVLFGCACHEKCRAEDGWNDFRTLLEYDIELTEPISITPSRHEFNYEVSIFHPMNARRVSDYKKNYVLVSVSYLGSAIEQLTPVILKVSSC